MTSTSIDTNDARDLIKYLEQFNPFADYLDFLLTQSTTPSAAQVAKNMGCEAASISQWRHNNRFPDSSTLYHLMVKGLKLNGVQKEDLEGLWEVTDKVRRWIPYFQTAVECQDQESFEHLLKFTLKIEESYGGGSQTNL